MNLETIREKFSFQKQPGGIDLPHYKNTKDMQTVSFEDPDYVILPMSQHIGVSCTPLVKVGDRVLVGQKIGESQSRMSAPIHASVSGTVKEIAHITLPSGFVSDAVVIENDRADDSLHPSVKPPVIDSYEQFVDAINESGLVGLGGAGFPTHVKFRYEDLDRIEDLVINAAECEPYLTGDYRQIMENAEGVLNGIRLVMEKLSAKRCFIAIEEHARASADHIQKFIREGEKITVSLLNDRYPKGAENITIYETTGKVVTQGTLPADHGVLVLNVTTVANIWDYMTTGMPLIRRRITVDGDGIREPKNLFVRIGTPIKDVAEFCGGMKLNCKKILYGGPMTGMPAASSDMPTLKNTGALLFFSQKALPDPSPCIGCDRCATVCPVNLLPRRLEQAYDRRNKEDLMKNHLFYCINCGSCTFVCPAHRQLAFKNQLAKALAKE